MDRTDVIASTQIDPVQCLVGEHEFADLEVAWNELFHELEHTTVFCSWQWLYSWWQAYGSGCELRLYVWREEGNLKAILPMFIRVERILNFIPIRVGRLVGDGSFDSDYLNAICHPEDTDPFIRSVLQQLAEARECSAWIFNTVPVNSPLNELLTNAQTANFWLVHQKPAWASAAELTDSFDGFLKARKPRFRSKIRSLLRRFDDDNALEFDKFETELPTKNLESLFALHQSRWQSLGETGVFAEQQKRYFYELFTARFADQGWLRFYTLRSGTRFLAHQMCFGHDSRTLLLQEGFDTADGAASYGQMLRALVFRHLIGVGGAVYDFLGGVSRNKTDWGAQSLPINCITLARGWKGRLLLQIPHIREQLGQLRSRFPSNRNDP